jgi:hypothetical protein
MDKTYWFFAVMCVILFKIYFHEGVEDIHDFFLTLNILKVFKILYFAVYVHYSVRK